MEGVFESISKNVKVSANRYLHEDGLLYCGICHKPTEHIITNPLNGEVMKVNVTCDCVEAELKARADREQAEERERRRSICFSQTNMKAWNFQNDDRRDERLSNAMEKYVENFEMFKKEGRGLLLFGNVGTGKTYYACCIANGVIDKDYHVYVTSFREIVNKLQGMWEGKQEYIDSLNKYSLLVIDDLGAERTTDFMQEQIFSIVDSRYRSGLPFIVTTNLSMEQIKKPQDIAYARIYDRILERCHPIKVDGVSRRRESVKDNYLNTNMILGL